MTDMVAKLDDYGKPAWLGVMVLGFIVFWPVGLAILAYMIWSGRMGCGHSSDRAQWQSRFADKFDKARSRFGDDVKSFSESKFGGFSSGNNAFDEYRTATLNRLEEEQREFRSFLDRLRHAKDKSEFDQFMADRRAKPATGEGSQPA